MRCVLSVATHASWRFSHSDPLFLDRIAQTVPAFVSILALAKSRATACLFSAAAFESAAQAREKIEVLIER